MKKYNILIGLLVVLAFLAIGGVWLYAQQLPNADSPLPRTGKPSVQAQSVTPAPLTRQSAIAPLATPTPMIGTPTAAPSIIVLNTPTIVTVTVSISPPPISNGVNLLLLGASGTQPTILGVMHDDGKNGDAAAGDGVYTLQVPFNQTNAGQIQTEASAAFPGVLKRIVSSPANLNFTAIPIVGAIPTDWASYDNSPTQTSLFSPQALASINSGDDETPPDIVISLVPNVGGGTLQSFISAYQNGWFAAYSSITSTMIDGRSALIADDSNAAIPHVPAIAAFIAGNSSVYVITALDEDASEFSSLIASLTVLR